MYSSNVPPSKAPPFDNPNRKVHKNFVIKKLAEFHERKERLKEIRATKPIFLSLKLKLIAEVDDFLRTYCFGAEGFSRSNDFRFLMIEVEMLQPRN